jgi:predicted nucleic acid-binding protein
MRRLMLMTCAAKVELSMVKQVLLHTDVVIHLLRKQEGSVKTLFALRQLGALLYVCPIVVAEIYAGAFVTEYSQIEAFFSFCRSSMIDDEVGKIAGLYANQYRKSHHKISLEDYLIAACANRYQLQLWTNNKKHYPMQDIQLFEESNV